MRVEVNVICNRHAAINHVELFHLEKRRVERRRRRVDVADAVVNPKRRGGVELACDLYLLRYSLYFHIEPDCFFCGHLGLSYPSRTIPYSL
jgi:hypothetical protein